MIAIQTVVTHEIRAVILIVILMIGLLAFLLVISGVAWCLAWIRLWHGNPILAFCDEPRAKWNSLMELIVIYLALLYALAPWITFFLSPTASPVAKSISVQNVAVQGVTTLAICGVIIVMLYSNRRSLAEYGFTWSQFVSQICTAVYGFCLVVIPMSLSLLATLPIRPPEAQHFLLRLLQDSPGWSTFLTVGFAVVVAAPMFEELMFRVIIQGWLTTLIPPWIAIALSSILFSLVHGWRNGIALLPLALLLGYVFYRSHRYWSVVMIHGLFNATMLVFEALKLQSSAAGNQ